VFEEVTPVWPSGMGGPLECGISWLKGSNESGGCGFFGVLRCAQDDGKNKHQQQQKKQRQQQKHTTATTKNKQRQRQKRATATAKTSNSTSEGRASF
jgi:hypothetical protein